MSSAAIKYKLTLLSLSKNETESLITRSKSLISGRSFLSI